MQLDAYKTARLARDPRFDGVFYIGVKSTHIFCRPICRARMPLEKNVEYIATATQAIERGYRPCLMCRPDSAPGSYAWKGVNTTLERALSIINQDMHISIAELVQKLGISTRYLHKLFHSSVQMSAKQYQLSCRLLLAKRLLHQTKLSIEQIAQTVGFSSARPLQHNMQKMFSLSPSQIRRTSSECKPATTQTLELFLSYRPPYNWEDLRDFYALRQLHGNEIVTRNTLSKCIWVQQTAVQFCAQHEAEKNGFWVKFSANALPVLPQVIADVSKILDLHADPLHIAQSLLDSGLSTEQVSEGIRLPSVTDKFEAGCRAVVGQQVTVKAAVSQLNLLQSQLAQLKQTPTETTNDALDAWQELQPFVRPEQVAKADVSFLRMPQARKDCLHRLAQYINEFPETDEQAWISLKGIGPWTINYVKMRNGKTPDVFLDTDLIIKQQIKKLFDNNQAFEPDKAAPWRSYLTLTLWKLSA